MVKPPLNTEAILPWEEGFVPDVMNQVDVDNSPTSVVIPIYNSGKFLEKTLRSLMLSDLRNVEIIISDGGSTDETSTIINHYSDIFSHIISEPVKGQSDAINKGFEKASGELLYWLNGDDLLLPYALNAVRNTYIAKGKPDLIIGNAFMTEKDLTPIHHFVYNEEKIQFSYLLDYASHHLIQPSVFFTRKAWESAGPLNIDDHYAMDADLFLGMTKQYTAHFLNQDLAYSVYHEECKTRNKRAESITQLALVQAKHGGLAEARNTLNILVDLFNAASQQTANHFEIELNDIIGCRETLKTMQEAQFQSLLNAQIKEV